MREYKANPLATIAVLLGGWMFAGDVQSLLALGNFNVNAIPHVVADVLLIYFAGRVLKPKNGAVPETASID
jgi:hypothetical protein